MDPGPTLGDARVRNLGRYLGFCADPCPTLGDARVQFGVLCRVLLLTTLYGTPARAAAACTQVFAVPAALCGCGLLGWPAALASGRRTNGPACNLSHP